MTTRKKVVVAIAAFFGLVLLAGIFLVPRLMDVDRYRGEVAARIREMSGKPAEIGRLALTIFPTLSIRADDFALGNPAGFPRGYMLKVRRISAELDARALLRREILIKSLDLDQADVNLLSDNRGRWNFERPANERALNAALEQEKPIFTLDFIAKVSISRAQVTAANLLASGRAGVGFFKGRGVSCELKEVNLAAFTASPYPGSPLAVRPAPSSPPALDDLWTSKAFAASPEARPAAQGTLRADSLRFGTLQATSVKTHLRLYRRQVFFDDLKFEFYGGRGSGDISFNIAGQNLRYAASTRLGGVDVRQLFDVFPDARGKMTGKLEGNLKLSGELTHAPDPLAGMRGGGQVSIRDGDLPTLQLSKNLMALARLGNLGASSGSPSSFSSITADINIANQRITSNKVTVVGNGYNVEGSGSVALTGEGSLDYQGMANLVASQGPITDLLSSLSGVTFADGKLNFPFRISGTLQKPRFVLGSARDRGSVGAAGSTTGPALAKGATLQPGQSQRQPSNLVRGGLELFKKKAAEQPRHQPAQPQP